MPKAFVNRLNMHYVQTGQGPNLVLIHGIASNLGQWQLGILPALVEHFRLTMYDLRGHGYSDMPATGYTPTHMLGDFSGLMDYLGIEQTSIVGHSYGGLVALCYALHHPERVDKSLQRGGIDIPEEKAEDIGYLIEQTVKLRGRSWRGMGARRAIARLTRFTTTTSFAQEYRATSSLTLDMIHQIQAPVLLIYGDRSPLTASFQALRDNLPNRRAAIVADGGHFYPLQHPETFVRHIKDFLEV